ncbi:MAG: SDR family NAD(P)-dependent oxidoreductase [Draconibacterium sp.]|nr:SDR family NAD(P)-dependent oxidoreductase [Draconibacterium sp.]
MKLPTIENRSVLVTGCSSGIGRATAELLRTKGWKVFPTARKAADLVALEQAGFAAVELDMVSSDSIAEAVERVLEKNAGVLGAVVNNAGFGMPGAIEDLTRDAMRDQFEVNLFGLQELTNQLIPVFRKQGYGRIINVSSVVGRIGLPFMGIYSASKFAVRGFLDTVRVEYLKKGLHVLVAAPGFTKSEIRITALTADGTQQGATPRDEEKMMSAEDVATRIFKSVEKRKRKVTMTFWGGKAIVLVAKLWAYFIDQVIYQVFANEPNSPFK